MIGRFLVVLTDFVTLSNLFNLSFIKLTSELFFFCYMISSSPVSIARLFDLFKGEYWAAGSLSVIAPRLRGHLMVLIKVAFSSASQEAMSKSSRVPVKWFRSPGVAKI